MSSMTVISAAPHWRTTSADLRWLGASGESRSRSVFPMMPLRGERISWLIIARKSDLARLAATARSRCSRAFAGQIAQDAGLPLQLGFRLFLLGDRRLQLLFAFPQRLLLLLQPRDVGADADDAAIARAPFVDQHPAAVGERMLECSLRVAVQGHALGHPFLAAACRVGDVSGGGARADDLLARDARLDHPGKAP